MPINILTLKETDKGRKVKYAREYCDEEHGRITSWNVEANLIFVLYVRFHVTPEGETLAIPRTGATSEGTRAQDLEFLS